MTAERRFTFDAVAHDYDKVRPGYPDAVFAAIAEAAPGRRLLEIGSGTGKATTGLVSSGFEVLGLEPGAAMVEAARANPALAEVRFERATFEAWNAANAPPFDAIAWPRPGTGSIRRSATARPRRFSRLAACLRSSATLRRSPKAR